MIVKNNIFYLSLKIGLLKWRILSSSCTPFFVVLFLDFFVFFVCKRKWKQKNRKGNKEGILFENFERVRVIVIPEYYRKKWLIFLWNTQLKTSLNAKRWENFFRFFLFNRKKCKRMEKGNGEKKIRKQTTISDLFWSWFLGCFPCSAFFCWEKRNHTSLVFYHLFWFFSVGKKSRLFLALIQCDFQNTFFRFRFVRKGKNPKHSGRNRIFFIDIVSVKRIFY